jgi:hypothetical protein
MNPITLSIGHTYQYSSPAGIINVDYIGPLSSLDGWYNFLVKSSYHTARQNMPGVSFGRDDSGDDEIISISRESVWQDLYQQEEKGDSLSEEKIFPEPGAPDTSAPAYMERESILKPDPKAAIVKSGQLKVENGVSPEGKNIPDITDYPELKTIDIAFTSKGGRLMNHSIEGTGAQNAVLHAYSYLYREASRGASEIRIHAGGRRVNIHDIRKYTPPALLNQLVAVSH